MAIRRLTQTGELIHDVFDEDGNRIAEYLNDEVADSSSLIREYIWAEGALVGVFENGALFYVRNDHIGHPVLATADSGMKVWEASYLPFGGVHASSGPNSDLRFPGPVEFRTDRAPASEKPRASSFLQISWGSARQSAWGQSPLLR